MMYKYFTAIIYDTGSTSLGRAEKNIYLSTKENIFIDGKEAMSTMKMPETRERGIEPSKTNAMADQITLGVHNVNEKFSKILYYRMNEEGEMFWNEKIEIFGHNNGTKTKLFMGQVLDVKSDPFETEYEIETADLLTIIKTELFSRELSKYIDEEESQEELIDSINTYRLPQGFTAYEEEVGDDPDSTEYVRYIEYVGHPFDFIYGVLDMIISKPVNKVGVPFLDGQYVDYIDVSSFEELRNLLPSEYSNNFTFRFYDELSDPFEFIKEQIFKTCVVFPFFREDGRLAVKFHTQPLSSEGILTLDESNIVSIDDKHNSMDDYANNMLIKYNHIKNHDEEFYNKAIYALQPEALKKTRVLRPQDAPLTFELEGINFGYTNPVAQDAIVQNIKSSYFSRYANSITKISLTTTMDTIPDLEVGGYIELRHKTLIEWKGNRAGERGLSGSDTGEEEDPIARLNSLDDWSGFIQGNDLGESTYSKYIFLNTQEEEIQYELFVGSEKSCSTNHNEVNDWLTNQGF